MKSITSPAHLSMHSLDSAQRSITAYPLRAPITTQGNPVATCIHENYALKPNLNGLMLYSGSFYYSNCKAMLFGAWCLVHAHVLYLLWSLFFSLGFVSLNNWGIFLWRHSQFAWCWCFSNHQKVHNIVIVLYMYTLFPKNFAKFAGISILLHLCYLIAHKKISVQLDLFLFSASFLDKC